MNRRKISNSFCNPRELIKGEMMHTVIIECQIHIFAVLLCLVFTGCLDVSFRCAVSLQEGPAHRTQLDSTVCSSTRHWHREEIYHSGGSNPLQTEPAGVDWPQISCRSHIWHVLSHLLSVTDNRPRINQEMHWRVWCSDRDRCASYIK